MVVRELAGSYWLWGSSERPTDVVRSCVPCRHVEGKLGFTNLVSLPDDLFVNMHHLSYLHLGAHTYLTKVPSFEGLSRLTHLALAYLFSVTELPSFEPLKKLKRLLIVYFPLLSTLPDMAPLTSLQVFSTLRPMQICCNGFFGDCDLNHSYCKPNPSAHIPQVVCAQNSSQRATPATRAILAKNAADVCQHMPVMMPEVPTMENVGMCEGVQFRQCTMPRGDDSSVLGSGICFITRFQVLACTLDVQQIQVRTLQISRGVGPACDPIVEALLGCSQQPRRSS